MAGSNAVVGIYNSHTEAEASIKELQRSGFDMKKLSVVGKDYHTEEHVVGYYNTGDRMKVWGKLGAFWGGTHLVEQSAIDRCLWAKEKDVALGVTEPLRTYRPDAGPRSG